MSREAEREPFNAPHVLSRLSDREWTIARALAEGLSYSEIALKLSISVHTVSTHVKSILRKTSLASSRRLGPLVQAWDEREKS